VLECYLIDNFNNVKPFRFIPSPRIPYQKILDRIRQLSWGRSRSLGRVSGYPLLVWQYQPKTPIGHVVLSAGVHGDEPSGIECLLELLESRPDWLQPFKLTVFPCLNPWGYEHNLRANELNQDINRQWKKLTAMEVTLAHQALRNQRFDLSICLHEDYDATGFYIYELSRGNPYFGTKIVQAVSRVIPIETRRRVEGRHIHSGVIQRSMAAIQRRQYWPEALYHMTYHCDRTITTETPTAFPIAKRVRAQKESVRVSLHLLQSALLKTKVPDYQI
jgi:murein peptide amidase A